MFPAWVWMLFPLVVLPLAVWFAIIYLNSCDEWSLRQWFVDLVEAWSDPIQRREMLGAGDNGLLERLNASSPEPLTVPIRQVLMAGQARRSLKRLKQDSPSHAPSIVFSARQIMKMDRIELHPPGAKSEA